jgi:hypothetical protein
MALKFIAPIAEIDETGRRASEDLQSSAVDPRAQAGAAIKPLRTAQLLPQNWTNFFTAAGEPTRKATSSVPLTTHHASSLQGGSYDHSQSALLFRSIHHRLRYCFDPADYVARLVGARRSYRTCFDRRCRPPPTRIDGLTGGYVDRGLFELHVAQIPKPWDHAASSDAEPRPGQSLQ